MNIKNKILIIISTIILIWCWDTNLNTKTNSWSINSNNTWKLSNNDTESIELINENDNKNISKDNQILELRKKLALRWLILKWDNNFDEWEYTKALVKYLKINKEIPNDKSIINKLGDVYYNVKNFDKAYKYYSQIKSYEKLDKNKAARTLISSMKLTNENIDKINKELLTIWLNKEELLYYKISLECSINFSECRKEFYSYFNDNKEKTTSWTWTNNEIKSVELNRIKKALENYENFQIEDLNYKWALVAWAFFENWLYPIAIETSKSILKEKPDYKPLIKIKAKSYYELWNYVEAKLNLLEYSKLINDDSEINFFLWVVYEKLNEYVLSTINFNKAIELWYKDEIGVYKRILFNYYELWDINKILDVFNIMLTKHKDKVGIEEYNLAIYYNIINDKIIQAKIYTKDALAKFPESEIFNWYMWWILMDETTRKIVIKSNLTSSWTTTNNDDKININKYYSNADNYINKWLQINPKSAMLNLIKGKLEINKWEYKNAFLYLTKTVWIDIDWEFSKMAKEELAKIKIEEK